MIPSVSSRLIPRLFTDFSKFVLVAVTDNPIEPLGYAAAIPFGGPDDLHISRTGDTMRSSRWPYRISTPDGLRRC